MRFTSFIGLNVFSIFILQASGGFVNCRLVMKLTTVSDEKQRQNLLTYASFPAILKTEKRLIE